MGFYDRLFRRTRPFKKRLAVDLIVDRASAARHPQYGTQEAVEALSLRQLMRSPEWTIVSIIYGVFEARQRRPALTLAALIRHTGHTESILARGSRYR